MAPVCQGFHVKMYFWLSVFLIHVPITCGYDNYEQNNFEIHKLLSTLNNDKNLKSFKFYPVKLYLTSDESNLNDNLNPSLRDGNTLMSFEKEKIDKSKSGKLLRYQHRRKVKELIEFMKERYSSTNYFYNEMKRIQSHFTVKDEMREMIEYCEQPQNFQVKQEILKLFSQLMKKSNKKAEQQPYWNENTNDLIINVLKNPYNDGVPG